MTIVIYDGPDDILIIIDVFVVGMLQIQIIYHDFWSIPEYIDLVIIDEMMFLGNRIFEKILTMYIE
jgi:hypothetical protein